MLTQIPIDLFFKYKHEPIYVISLVYSYEEFSKLYNVEYEEWEERIGIVLGATFLIENERYFIKACKDPEKPYCQIGVYVQANCKSPKKAVDTFIKNLKIPSNVIEDIGETFFYNRWQVVRKTKEDGDIAIENCTKLETAQDYMNSLQNKYDDELYIREAI